MNDNSGKLSLNDGETVEMTADNAEAVSARNVFHILLAGTTFKR